MEALAPDACLRDARDAYLNEYGFSTAAYTDKWVHVKFGPFPLVFPSTKTRRFAIRFHDLHHTLTGYRATPIGEAEIGAWEVATGCRRLWAAWALNLLAMGFGLVAAPRRTFSAFVRGRNSQNLYGREFDEALLEQKVDDIRKEIGLDQTHEAKPADYVAYAFWCAVAIWLYVLHAAVVVVPIAAAIWWFVWR
jgi:hypothetical protein